MDTYETMFSASYILNEQIARQIFEVLPEHGPVVAIVDRDGNCWPSNSEEYARLNLSEAFLQDLRAKVDDGVEPVVAPLGDACVTVAQLATEQTNCGYVVVVLPRSPSKSTVSDIDLLEAFLSQITLVARLVEKNGLLAQARRTPYGAYLAHGGPTN
jgi:hypothetical protein